MKIDEVFERAAKLPAPGRVVLSAVAAPFYAVGFVVGFAIAGVLWVCAALAVGVVDGRARAKREQ